MSEFRLLIDGKLVPGAAELAVINPATEDVLATAPRADRAQLDQAVAAAKAPSRLGRRYQFASAERCSSNWPMQWRRAERNS